MDDNSIMKPKVSILIPTYNRLHYFIQALMSALNQTYENIEIIICDNSENSDSEKAVKLLEHYYKTSIKYYKNPRNIGYLENLRKCFDLASGKYINYLLDDDLLHPQKIEKMMGVFQKNKNVSLVTSVRLTIDEKGCPAAPKKNTKKIFKTDTIINGKKLAAILLVNRANYIGVPSTVLFKKDRMDEPFGVYSGRESLFSTDMASWLNILEKGNAVYLTEPLSYYRIHKFQLQNYPRMKHDGRKDWDAYIRIWQERNGLLSKKKKKK